jgi:hypothetical protein
LHRRFQRKPRADTAFSPLKQFGLEITMDLLRSGTLAALLLVLPGAAGCQALFSKARIESPEEAAISKSVKARLVSVAKLATHCEIGRFQF